MSCMGGVLSIRTKLQRCSTIIILYNQYIEEIIDMIASVHYFYPSLHIVTYNLGLTNLEIERIILQCACTSVQVQQVSCQKVEYLCVEASFGVRTIEGV